MKLNETKLPDNEEYVAYLDGDESDRARLAYGGHREEWVKGGVRRVPDVSRAAAADIQFGSLPPMSVTAGDFGGFIRPGTTEWDKYFVSRKVVKHTNALGREFASVTSNIADVYDQRPRYSEPKDGSRVRKYLLAQILTDPYLIDKFSFDKRKLSDIKNMGIADPERAALVLQNYIRSFAGSEDAQVSAGEYGRSVRRAWDAVEYFASSHPVVSAGISSLIIGKKIILYGTDAGEKGWKVMGPLRRAALVQEVFRMVSGSSPASVMFAMGPELVILDIDIHNGVDFESPLRECHAGSHSDLPDVSSRRTLNFFSGDALGALAKLCKNVLAVEWRGDKIASAVRLDSNVVLVNTHVLDEAAGMTLDGRNFEAWKRLSQDLWAVRCPGHGREGWSLRAPVVGESVIVCYRRYDKILFTSPVAVREADDETMTFSLTDGFGPGMSGAAIVAMADMSLLGLYDGVSRMHGLGAVFSPAMYSELCTDEVYEASSRVESDGGVPTVYAGFQARGLEVELNVVADCLIPVEERGEHRGTAFQHAGTVYTTVQCASGYSIGSLDGSAFEQASRSAVCSAVASAALAVEAVVRLPQYGEEVCVVAADAEGPYFTSSTSGVVRLDLDRGVFAVGPLHTPEGLPLVGGVVVAVSDCAVLGLYSESGELDVFGAIEKCCSLPRPVREAVGSVEQVAAIGRAFPSTHASVWPASVVQSIASAARGQQNAVVEMGRAAATAALALAAHRAGVRQSESVGDGLLLLSNRLKSVVDTWSDDDNAGGGGVDAENLLFSILGGVYAYEDPNVFDSLIESCVK